MAERDDRIGFVAEDFDPEDGSRLTGTFSAHWESREAKDWGEGPAGVSTEEAIGWARRQATRVSVLLYDDETIYSAGKEPYGDLPQWPEEGILMRPQPLGAPRDGSVQEIPWRVRCEVEQARRITDEGQARLRAVLGEDPRVARIETVKNRGRLIVELDYTAGGAGDATVAADHLVETVLGDILPEARLRSSSFGGR